MLHFYQFHIFLSSSRSDTFYIFPPSELVCCALAKSGVTSNSWSIQYNIAIFQSDWIWWWAETGDSIIWWYVDPARSPVLPGNRHPVPDHLYHHQPLIFFKYSLRPLSYKLNWLKKSISKNSFIFIDMHIIEIFLKLPKLQIKVWIFLTSLYSTLKYDERGKSQNLNS